MTAFCLGNYAPDVSAPGTTADATGRLGQFGSGILEHPAVANAAPPVVADILRRARTHQRLTLRQVEQKIGIPNAHLSQIERGVIRRPNVGLLLDLAELYELDYQQLAEWSGYLEPHTTRTSGRLAGMALKLFTSLDAVGQREALQMLEELRNGEQHLHSHTGSPAPKRQN